MLLLSGDRFSVSDLTDQKPLKLRFAPLLEKDRQSVGRSVGRSVGGSVGRSVGQSVGR